MRCGLLFFCDAVPSAQVGSSDTPTFIALLGEKGKVTAMSTYRFASVGPSADGAGVMAMLRGAPGELVQVRGHR
jgi:hypothetical protein